MRAMLVTLLRLLVTAFFLRYGLAESLKGTIQQSTLYSCQLALSKEFQFGCDDGYWPCTCSYEPLGDSVVACMDAYLPEHVTRQSGREVFINSCSKYAKVDLTLKTIEERSQNASKWIRHATDDSWNHTEIQYTPVLIERIQVTSKIRDYKAFLGNFDKAQYYGVIINMYWIGICLWFGIWSKIKRSPRLNSRLVGSKINNIRQRLTLPLLFGSHQQPSHIMGKMTSLLPTTLEGVILSAYFILNTVFLIYAIEVHDDNQLFGPNSSIYQLLRLSADRAGVLAFAHFPILILFAGRNNMLIGLSGLSYSTFMIFHKWTARVMVIDAGIHSVCYTLAMISTNGFFNRFTTGWFVFGWFATILSILIVLFAVHNLRVAHYELFLVTHILFAIWFFASCWLHCITFGWLDWIAGSLTIWGIDRVVRLYKLFKFGSPRAQICYSGDETFKVIVKRPHDWKPYPGCYVFIHFLHWSIFWQSHPFTIIDSVLEEDEVTIYIKAKSGVTSKVMSLLGSNGITQMRVSLEGPYGNPSPCESYDNVVLFAGGNGIPGPFYHALHLAERSLIMRQRIRLIWTVRNVGSIQWFESELKRLQKTGITCDIYISRNFVESEISKTPMLAQYSEYITFHAGRAPSAKILGEEFANAKGSVGIVTCGPGIMCDEIRQYVAENLDMCLYRVDLFEELQVW